MVIIGIVLSFVVVAFGDFGQSRRVMMQQQHLGDLIKLARIRAIIEAKTYGLNISKTHHTFYQFEPNSHDALGQWSALSSDLFKKSGLAAHQQMTYTHPLNKQTPEIILTPDGQVTPFQLTLTTQSHEKITMTVSINGLVTLTQSDSPS